MNWNSQSTFNIHIFTTTRFLWHFIPLLVTGKYGLMCKQQNIAQIWQNKASHQYARTFLWYCGILSKFYSTSEHSIFIQRGAFCLTSPWGVLLPEKVVTVHLLWSFQCAMPSPPGYLMFPVWDTVIGLQSLFCSVSYTWLNSSLQRVKLKAGSHCRPGRKIDLIILQGFPLVWVTAQTDSPTKGG